MFSYVFPMAQCFQSPDGKSLMFPGKVTEAWESSGWFIQQGPFNKWGTGDIPSSWYEIPGNLNKHGTEKTTSKPHPISSNSTKRRPPHVICLWTSIHHYPYRTINSTIIQHHPVLPKKMPRNFQKISTITYSKSNPNKQLSSANLNGTFLIQPILFRLQLHQLLLGRGHGHQSGAPGVDGAQAPGV